MDNRSRQCTTSIRSGRSSYFSSLLSTLYLLKKYEVFPPLAFRSASPFRSARPLRPLPAYAHPPPRPRLQSRAARPATTRVALLRCPLPQTMPPPSRPRQPTVAPGVPDPPPDEAAVAGAPVPASLADAAPLLHGPVSQPHSAPAPPTSPSLLFHGQRTALSLLHGSMGRQSLLGPDVPIFVRSGWCCTPCSPPLCSSSRRSHCEVFVPHSSTAGHKSSLLENSKGVRQTSGRVVVVRNVILTTDHSII
ncbi:hypothetical protein U9M48_002487 [Paspalum notatum var. saurae]|uniref:Uncharacterized protein n=1 Tax=Paspalum notatum var. saurae TaxID=547442 RepID=A0AAQ3SJU7_PASNO